MARVLSLRTGLLAAVLGGAALLAAAASDDTGDPRPVPANLAHAKESGSSNSGGKATGAKQTAATPDAGRTDEEEIASALRRIALEGDRYKMPVESGELAELTLDPEIQKAAEETLARAKAPRGAVVVMRTDGEILALAGLEGGDTDEPKIDHELTTRTWAPAASIFKLVTAAALIDAGVSPDKRVCYHGGFRSVTAANLKDDPRRDRRCEDLAYAIARSQNALIAKLAHRHLDKPSLLRWAKKLGMDEAPEFCTDTDVCTVELPEDPLEFARVSAGFWKTRLSVLGAARMTNILASGGMDVAPRLLRDTDAPAPQRAMPEKIARAVGEMMVGTTENGTGYKGFHDRRGRPFLKGIDVAGKTGTLTRKKPSYLQYSWFVGYAPADKPEVVIAVLLGNPMKWHLKAHTAARLVLQKALD